MRCHFVTGINTQVVPCLRVVLPAGVKFIEVSEIQKHLINRRLNGLSGFGLSAICILFGKTLVGCEEVALLAQVAFTL